MKPYYSALLAIVLLPAVAGPVFAHPGDHGAAGPLTGVIHPLFGWDHLLAIAAISLWAARHPIRKTISITIAWTLAMAAGAIMAFAVAAPPALDGGLALSLLLSGLLLAGALRLPVSLSVVAIALFAVMHGFSHGASMPPAGRPPLYFAGMLTVTAGLQGIALVAGARASERGIRAIGAGVAATGSWLLLSA